MPFVLRPRPLVRVPRCLFRLSERGDGLHSDVQSLEYFFSWLICPQRESARTTTQGPGCLPACVPRRPSSNPEPALGQTSPWEHGMIYSAQLSGSTEICELVKQRSFMVRHKAVTAFLTYKASQEWPKGALNDAFQFRKWPFKSWPDTSLYLQGTLHTRGEVRGHTSVLAKCHYHLFTVILITADHHCSVKNTDVQIC